MKVLVEITREVHETWEVDSDNTSITATKEAFRKYYDSFGDKKYAKRISEDDSDAGRIKRVTVLPSPRGDQKEGGEG